MYYQFNFDWIVYVYNWWFVRVTLVVGLVFLPQNCGLWWGSTKALCHSLNADGGIPLGGGGNTSKLHVVAELVWTLRQWKFVRGCKARKHKGARTGWHKDRRVQGPHALVHRQPWTCPLTTLDMCVDSLRHDHRQPYTCVWTALDKSFVHGQPYLCPWTWPYTASDMTVDNLRCVHGQIWISSWSMDSLRHILGHVHKQSMDMSMDSLGQVLRHPQPFPWPFVTPSTDMPTTDLRANEPSCETFTAWYFLLSQNDLWYSLL